MCDDGRMKENVGSVSFCIESISPGLGRNRFEIDEGGFYIGVPISAIGVSTRNNSYYDVESFVSHLENPNTRVNLLMRERHLYGEYGHPRLEGLSHEEAVARVRNVYEDRTSHLFKRIYTGPLLESGGRIVYADLKPCRGLGADVKESLDDPEQNTSFSIRTLTSNTQKGSISYRKMLEFITADFVNIPGFLEASKAFAHVGTESLGTGNEANDFINIELPKNQDGFYKIDGISTESFTNSELNELFGSKQVTLRRRTISFSPTTNSGNRFFQPIVGDSNAGMFLKGF